MTDHRHRFGQWRLHRTGRHPELSDKEYARAGNFPPFWVQRCDCGWEHWYRSMSRPLASMRFREMFKSRVM